MKTYFLAAVIFGALPCIAQISPLVEFANGDKQNFRSKGNLKAKGVDLSFEYPKSWRALDGDRPNVVQKFVSESGAGLEFATISVRALPAGYTPSAEDLDEAFSPEGLKNMVPMGARIVESKRTQIDNQPAAYCRYILKDERAALKMLLLVQHYVVYYRGHMIFFAFSVGDFDSTEASSRIAAKARNFAPLYQLMANSVIIHDQYK